ncbi:Dipeptide transport system permease protein DppC [Koleobacter methoxysyntrophicus]|uniref:Dipeptide transport system permease protein DppC n=1 Tax=Koleobacter methoxysyntrophicus TaxID=2751313 RepID=A0A8A0RJL6_9FIRM|nr:ABC transporter permease [Koleobacter methoxysyntrophicus]QSQ07739.1 Dipeptide transport system permease protein DppC [Koleobacter methoxysyntrophicus]
MEIERPVISHEKGIKFKKKKEGRSLWADGWIRLKRNKLAMFGLFLVTVLVLAAIFAPLITPYSPYEQFIWTKGKDAQLAPPSREHWFGTDIYGRDIYTRVVYGARISLQIALASTLISVVIGVILGAIAGYYGGKVDDFISWLINVIFAFPFLFFVLAIVAYLPPSLTIMYFAIGFVNWAEIARVVRGQVLSIKTKEFVEAAVALGARDFRVIFRHILPNVMAPVIVQATLGMGSIIMLEAGLSFLGFGVQPPEPSWGYMIDQGRQYLMTGKWWWSVFPGFAIMMLVLGFNLLGDGLRDALDPRLKQ